MGIMVLPQTSRYYPQSRLGDMQNRHGPRWSDLMAWVVRLPGSDPHVMALTRTLRQISRRFGSRANQRRDPFCTFCAGDTLAAFSGSEEDLLVMYHRNLRDINDALPNMRQRRPQRDRKAQPGAAIA